MTLAERFWPKVDRRGADECWPWTAATLRGYGAISWDGQMVKAPRVSMLLAGKELPVGMEACHTCDNKLCVNPRHLYAGTRQQNIRDGIARARYPRGTRHYACRLSDLDIQIIRGCRADGVPNGWLADWFGVSPSHISNICSGRARPEAAA